MRMLGVFFPILTYSCLTGLGGEPPFRNIPLVSKVLSYLWLIQSKRAKLFTASPQRMKVRNLGPPLCSNLSQFHKEAASSPDIRCSISPAATRGLCTCRCPIAIQTCPQECHMILLYVLLHTCILLRKISYGALPIGLGNPYSSK